MRFIAKATLKEPPTEEVLALIPAEQARVKELTEQGLVKALYVSADQSTVWAIWNCESQDVLEEALKTLPLHDYLNTEITLLSDDS